MTACPPLVFSLTADQWPRVKRAVAERFGITVGTDADTQTHEGFTVAWNYSSSAAALIVQCTDSPWWAPCESINAQITQLVNECLVPRP
jgi:hypothetical protein